MPIPMDGMPIVLRAAVRGSLGAFAVQPVSAGNDCAQRRLRRVLRPAPWPTRPGKPSVPWMKVAVVSSDRS